MLINIAVGWLAPIHFCYARCVARNTKRFLEKLELQVNPQNHLHFQTTVSVLFGKQKPNHESGELSNNLSAFKYIIHRNK